ncbi:MAG: hypothetical protein ABIQ02_13845 [Saprospiraceae bacterium]
MKFNESKIAKWSMIIVLIALVRIIGECFRLDYIRTTLSFEELKPFLIGALVCTLSVFTMVLLSFSQKHKMIIIIAVVTIILLFAIKFIYLV